jgi:hypothetical protein
MVSSPQCLPTRVTRTGNSLVMPRRMAIAGVMGDVERRSGGDHLGQTGDWKKM